MCTLARWYMRCALFRTCSFILLYIITYVQEAFTLRSHYICITVTADPVNYEENSKEFGVNYRSKLLELEYFNACSGGLVADVMHWRALFSTKQSWSSNM